MSASATLLLNSPHRMTQEGSCLVVPWLESGAHCHGLSEISSPRTKILQADRVVQEKRENDLGKFKNADSMSSL